MDQQASEDLRLIIGCQKSAMEPYWQVVRLEIKAQMLGMTISKLMFPLTHHDGLTEELQFPSPCPYPRFTPSFSSLVHASNSP